MSSIETRKIEGALTTKGFRKDGGHHKFFFLYHSGKKTSIRTKISHSAREYGDNLLSKMARQIKLSKSELLAFIGCELSEDAYVNKMIGEGFVKITP